MRLLIGYRAGVNAYPRIIEVPEIRTSIGLKTWFERYVQVFGYVLVFAHVAMGRKHIVAVETQMRWTGVRPQITRYFSFDGEGGLESELRAAFSRRSEPEGRSGSGYELVSCTPVAELLDLPQPDFSAVRGWRNRQIRWSRLITTGEAGEAPATSEVLREVTAFCI